MVKPAGKCPQPGFRLLSADAVCLQKLVSVWLIMFFSASGFQGASSYDLRCRVTKLEVVPAQQKTGFQNKRPCCSCDLSTHFEGPARARLGFSHFMCVCRISSGSINTKQNQHIARTSGQIATTSAGSTNTKENDKLQGLSYGCKEFRSYL